MYVHRMALHLTDPETDKLARELASRTGESLTGAVQQALRERLARVAGKQSKDEEKLLADVKKILSKVSPAFRRQKKTGRQMIEELYDEDGLPR